VGKRAVVLGGLGWHVLTFRVEGGERVSLSIDGGNARVLPLGDPIAQGSPESQHCVSWEVPVNACTSGPGLTAGPQADHTQ